MKASQYVSTKIGTIGDMTATSFHGGGKTHPGAICPFGMVAFGPDTLEGGDNGSGYSYHHTTIDGFSINHMSGVGWYGDLGNFQVMPTTGKLNLLSGTYRDALTTRADRGYESDFRHETEITEAGYYAVTLDTYGVRAETTSSVHAGMIRMTYPADVTRRVQINLARRIAGRSPWQELTVTEDRILEGRIHCPSTHGGFGRGAGRVSYDLYFRAEFSEPWADYGVWNKNAPVEGKQTSYSGEELWFYGEFPAGAEPVCLKVAVSYVNPEGARDNFAAEAEGVSFDEMHAGATAAWEEALSVISVEDPAAHPDTLTVFYTTLYHALLDPRIYSDVNGNYLSADNTVRHTESFAKRTVFSVWDVFRSEFPLLILIKPDAVNDMINSLIDIAEYENVSFPRWELLGHETGCMLGDPGIVVTVDAYNKGIRNFDVRKAYEICLKTVFDPASKRTCGEDYNRYGYVPDNISATLENVYADFCIGLFAEALGDEKNAAVFRERAQNYRNIFSPEVGWMRRRDEEGNWAEWKGIYDTEGCVESNIFQQSWFVPHDPQGLIGLMGKETCLTNLERLMAESDLSAMWNDAYNHPNEPCHHLVHLFTELGLPSRTQYWVRRIQKESYNTTEYGFCGNEDVGQMSAWFALTALGFHMMAPGTGIFYVNTPLFRRAEIRLSEQYHARTVADTLVIECDRDPAENLYICGIDVNGAPIHRAYLTWEELSHGGVITYHLSDTPDDSWAI
ncbi:MAG: glycoside hydrolase family 92 protein [Ruminococcaceae bacterium]|nr:glycoside hydrolase family 92 protein [Oscillospiraceae bacterium]